MAFTRISITLPPDVLQAADRRARALDRSRSWLIVEAIRAYVAKPDSQRYGTITPGLGPSRQAQLESDLRLTPERRVHAAQETARLAELVRGSRGRSHRVISFDRYEDYVTWQRTEHLSP